MNDFIKEIERAESIVILGHIRPDGDCVGSCLGVYNYVLDNYPEKTVDIYLDEFKEEFMFMRGAESVLHDKKERKYDLCISLDSGDLERHGEFVSYFHEAKRTLCVDHHVSNMGYGDVCFLKTECSAAAEAIFTLLDEDKIGQECAECLYLGIVHDTGVFKHPNTTRQTMEIAGILLEKGARSSLVIDGTFYKKTFKQNKMLAKALENAFLMFDGKVIVSCLAKEDFDQQGATNLDTDGVVDALRITDGVECALWMYEYPKKGTFKCSLRSNEKVNVNLIACSMGGGGHIRAAGCEVEGDKDTIILRVTDLIKEQLDSANGE
ncbi:MAG: bifunctional oligoribonuclease/PAP phosphatase NrnA [Lachnospiraceae bacterium]|nr:bifunctional oligoribonuclease/PAP phosphatase NrnA [Lachnospiraceae bacterium]MDE6625075.1 bifunctional oligoribonuclease/PAP phosphatase NrnA [Lachnospiraceae bacterium]